MLFRFRCHSSVYLPPIFKFISSAPCCSHTDQTLQRVLHRWFPLPGRLSPQMLIHRTPSVLPLYPLSLASGNFLHEPSVANLSKIANHIPLLLQYFLSPFPASFFCLAFMVYLLLLYMVHFPSWSVSFTRQVCSLFQHQCLTFFWLSFHLLSKWMSECYTPSEGS